MHTLVYCSQLYRFLPQRAAVRPLKSVNVPMDFQQWVVVSFFMFNIWRVLPLWNLFSQIIALNGTKSCICDSDSSIINESSRCCSPTCFFTFMTHIGRFYYIKAGIVSFHLGKLICKKCPPHSTKTVRLQLIHLSLIIFHKTVGNAEFNLL